MNIGIVAAKGFKGDLFHVGVVSWVPAKKGDRGQSVEVD